ncbi:MAG TPA: VCBS repeat-containing protein [Polyangia bacterium]|nr:VCBS repeat-containing protein [Polyangia bacterium]
MAADAMADVEDAVASDFKPWGTADSPYIFASPASVQNDDSNSGHFAVAPLGAFPVGTNGLTATWTIYAAGSGQNSGCTVYAANPTNGAYYTGTSNWAFTGYSTVDISVSVPAQSQATPFTFNILCELGPEMAGASRIIYVQARRARGVALVGGNGWSSIPVATSNGDGTFTVTNSPVTQFNDYASQNNAWNVTGDFDGNGTTDWISLNSAYNSWSTIPVAFSSGDGSFTFTNASTPTFTEFARTLGVIPYVGDFNGDQRSDIALIPYDRYAGWSTLPVAFSNGDGTFRVTNQAIDGHFLGAALFGAIVVGDYNGDGTSDFAVMDGTQNQQGDNNVYVALSNGDGSFDVVYQVPANLSSSGQCSGFPSFAGFSGRFNQDKYDDLATLGPSTFQCAALSNGNGTFRMVPSSVALNTNQAFWFDPQDQAYYPPIALRSGTNTMNGFAESGIGDYDGDGCTDYVFFGFAGPDIYTLHSKCDGTFELLTSAVTTDFGNWVDWSSTNFIANSGHFYGDFNKDGKTDILLTGGSGWTTVPIALSNGDGTFTITNDAVTNFPQWSSSAATRWNGGF